TSPCRRAHPGRYRLALRGDRRRARHDTRRAPGARREPARVRARRLAAGAVAAGAVAVSGHGQQDDQGTAAAVVRAGLAEGKDLATLHEPARHLVAQDGLALHGAEPLAMDDANTATLALPALGEERRQGLARLVDAKPVQVELVHHRPVAAAQLSRHVGPDAGTMERKAFVDVEVAADVDVVGEGLGERGGLVDLALAGQGRDAGGRAHIASGRLNGLDPRLRHLVPKDRRLALALAALAGEPRRRDPFLAPALGDLPLQLAELGGRVE